MILSLLNFAWIFLSTFIMGFGIIRLFEKCVGKNLMRLDFVLISGIVGATVYAEFFSIFHSVSILATMVFICLEIAIVCVCRKSLVDFMKNTYVEKNFWPNVVVIILLVFAGVVVAAQGPYNYDTGLYHAQAIQWIEKYGCVKGLGNLHNRFAYNSSFMCLQALYSWHFIVNQSLHSMNTYLAIVMMGYVMFSFRFFKEKKEIIPDCLNIAILVYCGYSLSSLPSPNTDFWPMILMLYVLSRWLRCTMVEEEVLLCVFAVYGTTVKLSVGFLVLMAVAPLVVLIKQKNWRTIGSGISAGVLIAAPFLIRNVIISGYLLYPYPMLDLFDVDWKMPAYTVNFDRLEIMAWGRALDDVYLHGEGFREWGPVWFRDLNVAQERLIVVNIVLILLLFLYCVIKRKSCQRWLTLFFISVIGLLAWFFSAPLIRYGRALLYTVPAIAFGVFIQNRGRIGRILGYAAVIWCCILAMKAGGSYIKSLDDANIKRPEDYKVYSCSAYSFENTIVYCPDEGDQSGYISFPAVAYLPRLNVIEFRDAQKGLRGGFRMKEEYADQNITPYGTEGECLDD